MMNVFKKLRRWWRRTLQNYRDVYSETHGPKRNRAERRRMAKMKKNSPKR